MRASSSLAFLSRMILAVTFIAMGALAPRAEQPAQGPAQKPAAEIKGTSTTQPVAGAKPAAEATATTATTSTQRVKFYGHTDVGFTYNPDHPNDHINFGRLFDDKSNQILLNQTLLTAERTLDPLAKGFDWGFKLQFMLGTDARYTQFLGEFEDLYDSRYQPDVVEAYLNLHFPILTPGGIDVKAGQFVTLEGAEVIDSTGNFFYSHSYIFNFGIPFKHTGVLATTHLNKYIDLYTGITEGVNCGLEDNNDSVSFHGGVGLNLLDGKVTTLASTHIGAENPNNNHDKRYLNDITTTIKLSEKLTSITDLNYTHDQTLDGVDCYGAAQYFTYAFKDWLSAGVRGEIFRDPQGFYVAAFPSNDGFTDVQEGEPTRVIPGGKTTYGALTFGLNIKPIKNLLIRPEVRFDRALNGDTKPFNDYNDRNMFTAALALTYSF